MRKRIIPALLAVICAIGLLVCLLPPAEEPGEKYIAFTFDDGPEYTHTPAMLEVLAQRDAKGTFFLVGKWTPGKDAVISQIMDGGHVIGSHTQDHVDLSTLSEEEIVCQLETFRDTMAHYTDQEEFLLRPPFGGYDQRVLDLAGVPVIHWSIDPAAGETVPAKKMARIIIREARDGAIVLMHDTTAANVDAVAMAMDALAEQGYEFVTVPELFRIKGVALEPGVLYREAAEPAPQP